MAPANISIEANFGTKPINLVDKKTGLVPKTASIEIFAGATLDLAGIWV